MSIAVGLKKCYEKKIVIATALVAGVISYLIFRKNFFNQDKYSASQLKGHSHDHHLTNVFAKAKKYATSKDVIA